MEEGQFDYSQFINKAEDLIIFKQLIESIVTTCENNEQFNADFTSKYLLALSYCSNINVEENTIKLEYIYNLGNRKENCIMTITLNSEKALSYHIINYKSGKSYKGSLRVMPNNNILTEYQKNVHKVCPQKREKNKYFIEDDIERSIHNYNQNGLETSYYKSKRDSRFGYDKVYKCFDDENKDTLEETYGYRAEDSIIIHNIYHYFSDIDENGEYRIVDSVVIGKNNMPNAKYLSTGGHYTWFDQELLEKYFNGKISLSEIKGNAYAKRAPGFSGDTIEM